VSFHRARYLPKGGPDGGDGGRGGSIFLRASPHLSTLYDLERRPVYAAEDGKPGQGGNRTGRSGKNLVIDVPCGTQVFIHPRGEKPDFDLTEPGQTVLVARGGRGGRGNKALATPVNQTPREAEEGEPGEEKVLDLELKLIADAGLVGLPNAGKSTLLRRLSRAHPKVGPYPFTTLHPSLGVAQLDEEKQVVLADIPGLIEGAHKGAGLGHEFLQHIERTKLLLHLVSCELGGPEELKKAWDTIASELDSYLPGLAGRVKLGVVTKLDLLSPEEGRRLVGEFSKLVPVEVIGISAVTGSGIFDLIRALGAALSSDQ